MHQMIEALLKFFYVATALGFVIFVHELGHFIAARKNGVKVEKFSLGFGPEIFGFNKNGTRYALAVFPLGGMVKLAGEEISPETSAPGDFFYQPWYRRIIVAVAGAVMNLVLAVLLFSFIILVWGISFPSDKAVIGAVSEGMPAKAAGLAAGDRIVEIDGLEMPSWRAVAEYIHARPEIPVRMLVERAGSRFRLAVTPSRESSHNIGLIGINPSVETKKAGVIESLRLGAAQSFVMNYATLRYLYEKITRFQRPELSGPIGIVGELAKAARRGPEVFLMWIAIISNAVALLNLLPIPVLDGGLVAFFLFEGITRKPLNEKIVSKINTAGLALVITIFVYATYSDIVRLTISK